MAKKEDMVCTSEGLNVKEAKFSDAFHVYKVYLYMVYYMGSSLRCDQQKGYCCAENKCKEEKGALEFDGVSLYGREQKCVEICVCTQESLAELVD